MSREIAADLAGGDNTKIIFSITLTLGARPLGAIIFGQLSQKIGRRYSMIAALVVSLLVIPMWAFGGSLVILAAGAFLMQVGVQGAWGIIPIHLNELAPDAVRGLMPGLAYQFGILVASPTNSIEDALRDRFGYSWALAGFELFVMISLTIILLLGRFFLGQADHPLHAVGQARHRDGLPGHVVQLRPQVVHLPLGRLELGRHLGQPLIGGIAVGGGDA